MKGMTAQEFRTQILVALIVGVLPVMAGMMSPWFLMVPLAMIVISWTGRHPVALEELRRREELEGPG